MAASKRPRRTRKTRLEDAEFRLLARASSLLREAWEAVGRELRRPILAKT